MARGLLVVALILVGATCRLSDLIGTPQGALLAVFPVAPDSLIDSAAVGSTALREDTISVTNIGGGELRWTASTKKGSTWLLLPVDSGTAPTPLLVLFDPTDLANAMYYDTVVVQSTTGGALEVPVRLEIHPCRPRAIPLPGSISDTLTTADCGAPHRDGSYARLYNFTGVVNDLVTIEVTAGYSAYVALDTSLAPTALPFAETGECLGVPGDPCLYYQQLPRSGTHHIEVTSTNPGDSGSFTLRLLQPRAPNQPDSLSQRLGDSTTVVPPGDTINQTNLLVRAVLSDPDLPDSLHLEAEVVPVGQSFSGPNVPNGPTVANGQAAWINLTGLADNTSYVWRVRAGDQTGRDGPWAEFGGNPFSFRVAVPHPPNNPTGLGQSKPDGTPIVLAATSDTDVVVFSATVTDQDPGDQLRLQVEVLPVGTVFSDSPTDSGDAVPTGPAEVRVQLGNNTSYHWQVRTSDQSGRTSGWVRFGGNPEPNGVDFRIALANVPNAPTTLAQFQSDGTTPIAVNGVTQANVVILRGVVSDPDVGQQVQLEVEVLPITQPTFTNTPNFPAGGLVANGGTASVTVGPLSNNTDYHWQARAKDATGRPGAWVSFPSPPNPANQENEADFRVQQPPIELVFTVPPPTTTVAGVTMTPPIQVTARDINGQTSTGFTGDVVMTLEPNPGGAMFSGTSTTTVAAVGGVATFNDLNITKAGTGYMMRATTASPSLFKTSNAFNITAAATTQLVFTTNPPPSTVAGAAMSPAIVVTAQDDFSNTTPLFVGTVLLSIASNGGTPVAGTLTGGGPVTAFSGVANFPNVRIDKVGPGYTLRAASPSQPGLRPDTSTAFNITPGLVTHLTFVTQPVTTAAGSPITPAVQVAARDANENTVTSFTSNVTMAIGTNPPGNGILSGTLTVAATLGVANFSNLNIDKIGTGYTLTATSAPFATTSQPFNIITSPISNTLSTVVATSPITACLVGCSTVAGTASLITVTARDGSNNPVQGATVVLSAIGTGTTLTQPATTTNASGVATGTLSSNSTANVKIVSAVIGGVGILDTDTVTVTPDVAASLVFTTQPAATTAGVAINSGSGGVVVTARDQFGNTATSFTGNVSMAIAAGPVGGVFTPTSTTTVAAVNGVAPLTNLHIYKSGAGYQLQATSGVLPPSPLSTPPFTINTAPVSQLAFVVQPVTTADSAQITPAVLVAGQDSVGNTVTTFTGLVRMFIDNPGTNPGGGTLSGTTQVNAVNGTGIATFSNLRINARGTGYTLRTSSSGLTDDFSAPFDIIAGPAAALFFTGQPSQTVANSPITPAIQITARDNQGNTATSFFGNVTLTIGSNPPGNGILTGGGPLAASAGVVSFPSASIDKAGSPYTLIAGATGVTSATSLGFNIIAGGVSPTLSTIGAAPASMTACKTGCTPGTSTASLITVTARDAAGNPIQGATVVLSSNGNGDNLTQPVTTTNPSGVATGTISDTVVEALTVNATIDGTLINPTAVVNVNAASPAVLIFIGGAMRDTTAGSALKAPAGIQVRILDQFRNNVPGATNPVGISILVPPSPAGATLSGAPNPKPAVNGVATFTNLSINQAGTGYVLVATGLPTIDTSSVFNITAGAATQLVITTQPSANAQSGIAFPQQPAVQLRDANNNNVSQSGILVTAAVFTGPGGATLSNGTATTNGSGLATFSGLAINGTVGNYTLRFTSGSLTAATSSTIALAAGNAAKLAITQQPSSDPQSGVLFPQQPIIQVQDAANNPVSQSGVMVTAAIFSGGGSLGGTATDATNGSGVATFTNLSIAGTIGGRVLRFTSTSPVLTAVNSATINVVAGPASKLVFTTQPSTTTAGQTIGGGGGVVVTAQDAQNNTATTYATNIGIAITIGTGTAGANLSGTLSVAPSSGVATFSDLSIDSAGTSYTLRATSGSLTAGTSTTFNINPGAVAQLEFTVGPSDVAVNSNISPAVEVTARDALGNLVGTTSVSIAIGTVNAGGNLTGTSPVNTVNGVATFSNLQIDQIGAYTLNASAGVVTSGDSNVFTVTP